MDNQALGSDENTKVLGGRLFPGFEVMSQWKDDPSDPTTNHTLIRFYTTDSHGKADRTGHRRQNLRRPAQLIPLNIYRRK